MVFMVDKMFKRILLQSLILIVGIGCWALLFNAFHQNGLTLLGKESDFRVKAEVPRISLAEAYEYFSTGLAQFIDCRSNADFEEAHIPGALSLPHHLFEDRINEILDQLDPMGDVVTYCDGAACDASVIVANNLKQMGFTRVHIFFGGWNEWKTAGYPIEP